MSSEDYESAEHEMQRRKDVDTRLTGDPTQGPYALGWTDQPRICTRCPVVARIRLEGISAEVRGPVREDLDAKHHGRFLVTVGGLFGSQTLSCKAEVAFVVLDMTSREKRGDRTMDLPLGAELIEKEDKG
jgi:hypothetical protein